MRRPASTTSRVSIAAHVVRGDEDVDLIVTATVVTDTSPEQRGPSLYVEDLVAEDLDGAPVELTDAEAEALHERLAEAHGDELDGEEAWAADCAEAATAAAIDAWIEHQ